MATEIIGREDELAELKRFLDAVDRVPAAFLLEGEAGIGKTVLWTAGVELARARGLRVLTAIPATAETRLSFAALADLLGPELAEVLPSLPAPQRRALESALLLEDAEGPPPDQRAVAFAFLGAVRKRSRGLGRSSLPWTTSSGSTPRRPSWSSSLSAAWATSPSSFSSP